MRGWLGVTLLLAACQFEPDRVEAAGLGDGPLDDAAQDGVPPGPDGGADAFCAPTPAFSDDYESTGIGAADERYGAPGCDREQDGELVLSPPNGTTCGWHYGVAQFPFDEIRITVEVKQTMNPSTDGESYLALFGSPCMPGCDPTMWIVLREVQGSMQVQVGETRNNVVAYSPTTHRWWQLRETGGFTYWEASADGVDFNTLQVIQTPPFADSMFLNLGAYASATAVTPGETHYDNLNLAPCP